MNKEEKAMQSRKNVNKKHYLQRFVLFLFCLSSRATTLIYLKFYDLERNNISNIAHLGAL